MIHVSQAYIDLVRHMSGNDKPFHEPQNNKPIFATKEKKRVLKENAEWLKASLTKLGGHRLKSDAKTQALEVFKQRWTCLNKAYSPKDQEEADEITFESATQRVWLNSEKAMQAAGPGMLAAWHEVYEQMKLPAHLDGNVDEEAEEDSDGEDAGEEEEVESTEQESGDE